jgi:DNA-binding CsgD family transcriptional regulator
MRSGAPNSGVIGREAEGALLADLIRSDAAARGVVLVGAPGIGKTALWTEALATAEREGTLALSARPSAPETGLAFAGLADLLADVGTEALSQLDVPLRRALEVALLRSEPVGEPPGERQIAAAVLAILRTLAARGALLVAVDDVNWLDQASADVLAFAARRLGNERVHFLFARRPGRPSALERAFRSDDLARIEVQPLSLGATRTILARRFSTSLPRRLTTKIHEASGGNPFYALEVGRRVVDGGLLPNGGELPIPESVEDLVGDRVKRLPPDIRRLLAAVSLGSDLPGSQLTMLAGPSTIGAAIEADVLIDLYGRLRPAHPLLAAAARAGVTTTERRAIHLELATLANSEEVKARHLALGTAGHHADLATRVAAASTSASARGAVADAVDLAEHALRLTPPGAAAWSEHLLELAQWLVAAGEHRRASELLNQSFESLPAGRARARAHLLLNESAYHGDQVDVALRHLDAALEESADEPDLHALVVARRSRYLSAALVQSIAEAERIAADELASAASVGPQTEREVLYSLAFARKLRGTPIDDLAERFQAASSDAFVLVRGVERIQADRLASRGLINASRQEILRFLASAEERGEGWSAIWLLHELAEIEVRAGNWDRASQLLDECDESPDRGLLDPQGYQRCRALVEAGRGHVEEAERIAARVIEAGRAEKLRWNLLEALRALGQAALLAHEPGRAAVALREVWEHTQREGIEELGEFPVAPDLVEALVELRQIEDSLAVIARVLALATAQQHPWGLATASRGEALVALASAENVADGIALTYDAAERYATLGLLFDHARTLRAAGRELRRLRKWGAAREMLVAAADAFNAIGSDGWVANVRADIERLGGRRASSATALTAAERQVAELAAEGRSNKEIAAALVVGISTVETHLRHAFAKLDVRSRGQLGAKLRQ